MKIRVISSRDEIESLSPDERVVHCAFRPNYLDIYNILEKCPEIKIIQMPRSHYYTIAHTVQLFLKSKNVELIEGDVQGHRKDVSNYYPIPSSVIEKIKEMKAYGEMDYKIEETVKRMCYNLKPRLISYLIREIEA